MAAIRRCIFAYSQKGKYHLFIKFNFPPSNFIVKNLSYQELYQYAYKLILNKHGDKVYENLHKSMRRLFQQFINRLENVENDAFI